MKYINKGRCIFCLRDEPQTTFKEKSHTISKSLGGVEIGFDICDECNHYFGHHDTLLPKPPRMAVEVCTKEIFALIRCLIEHGSHDRREKARRLRSTFFNFRASENRFEVKSSFKYNSGFLDVFTNQFKRGIYEFFLQEYHRQTGCGLEERFNNVRNYARYNIGDLPLYHLRGDNGVLLLEGDISIPRLSFSENQIEIINAYGFYVLYLWGYWFYLEVTPMAEFNRESYLKRHAKKIMGTGFVVNRLIEVKSIFDIDFTLQNFK